MYHGAVIFRRARSEYWSRTPKPTASIHFGRTNSFFHQSDIHKQPSQSINERQHTHAQCSTKKRQKTQQRD